MNGLRIIYSSVRRTASQDSANAFYKSYYQSVFLQSHYHIGRAGGLESALMADFKRRERLVHKDGSDKKILEENIAQKYCNRKTYRHNRFVSAGKEESVYQPNPAYQKRRKEKIYDKIDDSDFSYLPSHLALP